MRMCLVNMETGEVENVVEFGGEVPANCTEHTDAPEGFEYHASETAARGWRLVDGALVAP